MADAGLVDFLQQLPAFLILMFCGAAFALVISLTLIVNARRQKTRRAAETASASAAALPLMRYDAGDMPDLDSLLSGAADPAPAPRPARPGVHPVTLSDGSTVEGIELLTVLRDVGGGGLMVQVNDQVHRVSATMGDEAYRSKVKALLRELASGMGAAAPEPRPAAPLPPAPVPSTGFDLPKFSLESASTPMTRKDLREASKAPIPQIDIAGAIEAYLQHKLSRENPFPGRTLHVRPTPDGGIRIQVDDTYYESVDEVAEPDILQFLRATIAEWQDRQH